MTRRRKPGYYMVDGDFAKHPDGSYVDICDFANCRKPCEQGWVRCTVHRGIGRRTICSTCHHRSIPIGSGIQMCTTPSCGSGRFYF